jgi:hypothetical protein
MLTTEIDGTIYLLKNDVEGEINNVDVELLDQQHELVANTTSSLDDFYIVPHAVAGDYWLRLLSSQLRRLGLAQISMKN